jgi:hypothetical protein
MFEGYRTLIFAGVTFVYGVLDKIGLPPAVSIDDAANAIMVLAALFTGFRIISTKPVGGDK